MGSPQPAIEVDGLRKSYGSTVAVDGIDLTIDAGEIFAILGPNGAGKTTTIEILIGLRTRDGGTVRVLDHDPHEANTADRARVGVVLQETDVEPFLTVRETVDLYRGWYLRPRPAAEVLTLCGLTEVEHKRASTLSGGQRRRLDVAAALVGGPEVLFLDEPTTGFDPEARREAWEMIRGLRDRGTTIVLTTHYLDEAQYLADRVAVIVAGRVVATGSPSSIAGHAAATHIRGVVPDRALPVDLGATIADGRFEIVTDTPTSVLRDLTVWATDNGLEIDDLTVSRPSLEDRYLQLIQDRA